MASDALSILGQGYVSGAELWVSNMRVLVIVACSSPSSALGVSVGAFGAGGYGMG
jgi:hypothetical protein